MAGLAAAIQSFFLPPRTGQQWIRIQVFGTNRREEGSRSGSV